MIEWNLVSRARKLSRGDFRHRHKPARRTVWIYYYSIYILLIYISLSLFIYIFVCGQVENSLGAAGNDGEFLLLRPATAILRIFIHWWGRVG